MEWVLNKPYVYVVSELNNKVTVFNYDWNKGEIEEKLQEISTVPEDFDNNDKN